jgi:hypothetical protein
MTKPSHSPELIINYSPKLDLRIALVSVEDCGGNACPDYRIEMRCCLRHPSGAFTYSADDLYFGRDSFSKFSFELQKLLQGLAEHAALKDMGEMMV